MIPCPRCGEPQSNVDGVADLCCLNVNCKAVLDLPPLHKDMKKFILEVAVLGLAALLVMGLPALALVMLFRYLYA